MLESSNIFIWLFHQCLNVYFQPFTFVGVSSGCGYMLFPKLQRPRRMPKGCSCYIYLYWMLWPRMFRRLFGLMLEDLNDHWIKNSKFLLLTSVFVQPNIKPNMSKQRQAITIQLNDFPKVERQFSPVFSICKQS